MAKIKVGVAGYGVIGQRLADGVACQGDMELVGVADVAPHDIGTRTETQRHAV